MENADLKAEFGGFHTWRFMGSYKWVISPLIGVITIVLLPITPLITTHEPPSRGSQG